MREIRHPLDRLGVAGSAERTLDFAHLLLRLDEKLPFQLIQLKVHDSVPCAAACTRCAEPFGNPMRCA
jgi:hypothetical protein